MLKVRRFSLALLFGLLACSDPVRVEPSPLTGSWVSRPVALQPSGSMQRNIIFSADGRFSLLTVMYGVYPGQSANDVSAQDRTDGRFRVEGNRIVFQPDSLITWDSFYGSAPPVVQKPYPYGGFYDDASYAIADHRLTITYTTYPVDAPVRTEATFWRVGLD